MAARELRREGHCVTVFEQVLALSACDTDLEPGSMIVTDGRCACACAIMCCCKRNDFSMQGAEVGGVWVYTDQFEDDISGRDRNRRRVHSSMYSNLRTNLPREVRRLCQTESALVWQRLKPHVWGPHCQARCFRMQIMAYSDFPFDADCMSGRSSDSRRFCGHAEVLL